MSESCIFVGNGTNDVWPLPFVPTGEPVVSLMEQGMPERRLLQGRDYSLVGMNIVMPLAEGARLIVRQASTRPVINAANMNEWSLGQPRYTAETALDEEELGGALERRYNECAQRLRLNFEKEGARLREELSQALKNGLESALAELAKERARGRNELRLASSPLAQRSSLVLPNGCMAGAFLTIETPYLPGTNSLLCYLDGVLARPNVDYEECGLANEASTTIRMLKGLAPGTALDCVVAAISNSEASLRAADSAKASERAAAIMLSEARDAQAEASRARSLASEDISSAQGWANAAKQSAADAYQAAVNAYDAAAQISLYRRQAGISAVKDMAAIHACSPGLFIVNPHLSHAPTPFMGVWPANCVGEMNWDGVFFLGGHCYPEDPHMPPKRPARPLPNPEPMHGGSDEWIPCAHSHQSPPEPCQSACVAWPPRTACDCACKSNGENEGMEEEGGGEEE